MSLISIVTAAIILQYYSSSVLASSPKVIIIGAGPAGIAAASSLLQSNVVDVKIIEAEDRIGGRINSVFFGDAVVDLGAEYCHGQENNIVYEMVKDLNVLKANPRYFEAAIFYSNGSKISGELEKDLKKFVFDFYELEGIKAYENASESKMSMKDLYLELFNSSLLPKYKNSPETLKILQESLKFAEHILISSEGSFTWEETSALSHFEECPGDNLLTWNGHGYKTILDVLLKSYPDRSKGTKINDKLVLFQTVTKISWQNKNQEVLIEAVNLRTQQKFNYSAHHVIFTPSLGVLRYNVEEYSMFEPQIPQDKREAIDNLGFDGVMKVIIHFPDKWWSADNPNVVLLWSEQDAKKTLEDFKEGPIKDGRSWVTQIASIVEAPNNPNVLIAWITGDMVPEIEQLSLNIVKKGVQYVLKQFLGKKYTITPIGEILMTRWCSNPNFRGTYSFEKAGSYKKNVSYQGTLSEPLKAASGKPLVLFAGEATSPVHFSTVHGAIETGFREAKRILDYYKNRT